jgi:hypothetical protein
LAEGKAEGNFWVRIHPSPYSKEITVFTERVYVPSIGRSHITNGTISYLKLAMPALNIVVVTDEKEVCAYSRLGVSAIGIDHVEPKTGHKTGLPKALQFCVDVEPSNRIIIMDDDLRFACRGPDLKLHQITAPEMEDMLNWLMESLVHTVHAGISARQGNNNEPHPVRSCTSMRSVLAYDLDYIRAHDIRFNRTVSKNDYDVTLQLLEQGCPNLVSFKYTHDQIGGPTLAGGTTEYRTADIHKKATDELVALHPRYVKRVYKEKEEWQNTGGGRWDVQVQWQKAYKESPNGRGE